MSLVAVTTVAALLIASPSATDADRLAANGGFLVGNAHRCGIAPDRVVRAGQLIQDLIVATSADGGAQDAANTRFTEFFLVSAFGDRGKEKLVVSCRMVARELEALDRRRAAVEGVNGAIGGSASRPFGPGDGE